MEPLLGSLLIFAGNFAPRGWFLCSGQLLSIAQNTALFSILGTTYGGDGQVTFGLPDLRGRVPIHAGQGPGLANYTLGQAAGTESATLLLNNLPAHRHGLNAVTDAGNTSVPTGAYLANTGTMDREYNNSASGTTLVPMNPLSIATTGNSVPFGILQPYLTLTFVIASEGIFPSRN